MLSNSKYHTLIVTRQATCNIETLFDKQMEIKSISLPFTFISFFFIIYRQLFDFHLQKRLKISHNNKKKEKKNIEISLNEHLSEVCEHLKN